MKKKYRIILWITFSIILITGCSDENTTEPALTTSAPMAKLGDIQAKVFNSSCALSGCHGSTNNQASLILTEGSSYANLVNVQSVLYPQFTRVQPGNSANSLLIKILKGEVSPRMPLNRDPLSAAVIDSIAKWIDNGALNN